MNQLRRFGILAALILVIGVGRAQAASTLIIVHKDLATSKITAEELESIYLGKKTLWESGSKIAPVILIEDSAGGKEFIETVLSKTVPQYRAYWKRRLFSGGGSFPRSFPSSAEIVDFVAKTPGAIGVVDGSTRDERVKVVALSK